MKTIYVAVSIETIDCQEKVFFVLGCYSTMEKAIECLKKQSEIDMDCYNGNKDEIERYGGTQFFTLTDGYNSYEYSVIEKALDE